MISYTKKDIEAALNALHLRENDTILIHSALQNFGRLEGAKFAEIPLFWRDFLLDKFTKHNLIIPTFSYNFPKTHFVDLREQRSEIGILSEEFRKIAPLRSTHPMFNFVGFGSEALEIIKQEQIEHNPFLQDSLFHRLFMRDCLMIFLGIDIRVCTFIVYIEGICGVKYRFFKPFSGEIITNLGKRSLGEFYHFCLPQSERLKVSYHRIQQELLNANILQFFPLGGSGIYAFRSKDFFHFVQNRLRQEPFILLETPPKAYYQWINNTEQIMGGGGK